jgi:hypothetical protein
LNRSSDPADNAKTQEQDAVAAVGGFLLTRETTLGVVVAAIALIAAFGVGYFVAGVNGAHPPVYTGGGQVGDSQASFQVGDTTYGFEDSVAWTDRSGSFHDGGWPDCLPKLQSVTGIRFAATTLWLGNVGVAKIVWVDCQST